MSVDVTKRNGIWVVAITLPPRSRSFSVTALSKRCVPFVHSALESVPSLTRVPHCHVVPAWSMGLPEAVHRAITVDSLLEIVIAVPETSFADALAELPQFSQVVVADRAVVSSPPINRSLKCDTEAWAVAMELKAENRPVCFWRFGVATCSAIKGALSA